MRRFSRRALLAFTALFASAGLSRRSLGAGPSRRPTSAASNPTLTIAALALRAVAPIQRAVNA